MAPQKVGERKTYEYERLDILATTVRVSQHCSATATSPTTSPPLGQNPPGSDIATRCFPCPWNPGSLPARPAPAQGPPAPGAHSDRCTFSGQVHARLSRVRRG